MTMWFIGNTCIPIFKMLSSLSDTVYAYAHVHVEFMHEYNMDIPSLTNDYHCKLHTRVLANHVMQFAFWC